MRLIKLNKTHPLSKQENLENFPIDHLGYLNIHHPIWFFSFIGWLFLALFIEGWINGWIFVFFVLSAMFLFKQDRKKELKKVK